MTASNQGILSLSLKLYTFNGNEWSGNHKSIEQAKSVNYSMWIRVLSESEYFGADTY